MSARRPGNFGTHLLDSGVCSLEQIERATQTKVVYGGRLGTNLVELGLLDVETVEAQLAAFLGVAAPNAAWLEAPDSQALAAVPAEVAAEHGVIPLQREGRLLHVAMRDPTDPSSRDEVGRATGFAIRGYAISELRLSSLLERHYGIAPEMRFSEGGGPPPVDASADYDPSVSGSFSEDLIDEATFTSLTEGWRHASLGRGAEAATADATPAEIALTPAAPDPRADVGDVARLEAELLRASDRDGVARAALRLARLHTRAAALFVVRGGIVTGFRGDGELVAPVLDGILLPLDLESAFSRAAVSGDPGRIPAPPDGVDRRILAALKREDACEFVVHPVRIRHHVVNLLYADNGPGPLAETSLAALGAVCDLLSRAYAGLILRRKQRLSPPSAA